ncbi:hypothetical protein C2G38_2167141 [Gigaspora rosea]|uniref:Uncharacterized protein n=1 Tax=Gigaspora rosea TaxID=44941 RepID=A0A397VR26_9GLOM|nr:hypothetical protein C2G38_2167141 [Gigaspora rosea]
MIMIVIVIAKASIAIAIEIIIIKGKAFVLEYSGGKGKRSFREGKVVGKEKVQKIKNCREKGRLLGEVKWDSETFQIRLTNHLALRKSNHNFWIEVPKTVTVFEELDDS